MASALSQADLDYCIHKGIISQLDGQFYKRAVNADSIEPRYKGLLDSLSGKLKHYCGIAAKRSVMQEHTNSRNQMMRSAKVAARQHYNDLNRPGMSQS